MERSLRCLTIAGILLAGCGNEDLLRPLEIELEGLSARAEILVLKIFPGNETSCTMANLSNAQSFDAPIEASWVRSEGKDRSFSLPAIEDDALTILAYSVDGTGTPIQFVCQHLSFSEVANLTLGVLRLALSPRVST